MKLCHQNLHLKIIFLVNDFLIVLNQYIDLICHTVKMFRKILQLTAFNLFHPDIHISIRELIHRIFQITDWLQKVLLEQIKDKRQKINHR